MGHIKLLFILACLSSCTSPQPEQEPPPVITTNAPNPPQPSITIASFNDNALDECTEMIGSEKGISRARTNAEKADHLIVVQQSCRVQFADRLELARCVARHKNASVTSHYYNVSTVGESDRYMQECLELGGDWTAIDRESREYRRAVIESRNAKLQKQLTKLQH